MLKIIDKSKIHSKNPTDYISIKRAVERAVDGADYESGALEGLQQTVSNQTEFLGNLVEFLISKDCFSAEELEALLARAYVKVVEE